MLRWSLLFFAFLTAVLGALNVFKSPDWSYWKLAVLAGEYGHGVMLLPLALGAGAWFTRGSRPGLAAVTVAVSLLAVGLLLKPVMQAGRIARTLPALLERSFGPVALPRPAFSLAALFQRRPAVPAVETMAYAPDLSLDFYRAVRPDARPVPCVVVVHGGGWDSGERGEISQFNRWLVLRGYAVAAIDYRLAPRFKWPAQREDILAALAFLQAHAATLGIDATRLVLFGRSAGGNMAEATAYTVPNPAIRGVIAFYAPADLNFAYAFGREDDVLKSPRLLRQFLGGPPETARANYDSASGYLHVGKDTPPTLLMHGELDTLVWNRQSERLAEKLAGFHVPHAFVSLPWATHAFEYNLSGPGGQLATYSVEWFLAAVTR